MQEVLLKEYIIIVIPNDPWSKCKQGFSVVISV